MNPLVFGSGAVGLALGSTLLAAGHRVRFVARDAAATALRREGLIRSGLFGEVAHPPDSFDVASDPAEFRGEPADIALICTKSFACAEAAEALSSRTGIVTDDAPVLLFQNGWGNTDHFEPYFASERIFCASILTGFRRLAPNHADITVHAAPTRVGSLNGSVNERVHEACEAMALGGIPAETCDRMAAELWAKILYNGCVNPLGALLGENYGALADDPDSRATMRAVSNEIYDVMAAAGLETNWPTAEEWLAHFYENLIPPTRAHESSMLQDLRAGRPTEIEALTGAVVKLADEHTVPVPANRDLLERVRAAEQQARS